MLATILGNFTQRSVFCFSHWLKKRVTLYIYICKDGKMKLRIISTQVYRGVLAQVAALVFRRMKIQN